MKITIEKDFLLIDGEMFTYDLWISGDRRLDFTVNAVLADFIVF